MKRRMLALMASAVLSLSLLAGCGGSEQSSESSSSVATEATEASADIAESEGAEQSGEDAAGQEQIPERVAHTSANGIPTMDNGYVRKDLTALELTKLMGNGINLGNTMEAYGHGSLGTSAQTSSYETLWGMPVTTQEMISGMKAAGFDTLRVPVAWTNMMNFEADDFTINEAYLNRVEEIINYAINEEMYVIINDHWDGGWWGMFGSATESTRERAMNLYVSMWTQIANRYKEYSDYLIFESANEELGNRLNDSDSDFNKDSGTLSKDECYEMANKINQVFVDTVRSTGGNNENRFLLIAGHDTDIDQTIDSRFVMPKDSAYCKLIVSVHYYSPTGYCLNESLSKWGTKRHYEEMNEQLAKLSQFTGSDYGVIIGEYGVLNGSIDEVKENTCDYLNHFLNLCDLYNYCPVLWDCNFQYKRNECAMKDADVAALYLERSYKAQSAISETELIDKAAAAIDQATENAVASFAEGGFDPSDASKAIAWFMYNSGDWSMMYSVGDEYDPDSKTEGIVATDVEVTGPGTYTVGLDFTGTAAGKAEGIVFGALAIGNGETLFPNHKVIIKEILINGEKYEPIAMPYTTSDNQICTRVNIYNSWVTKVPSEARVVGGNTAGVSPCIVNPEDLTGMESIYITFTYVP